MLPVNIETAKAKLLAIQPVYTVAKDLFGFELLFRHDSNQSASEFGEDLATREVLVNLCTGIIEQSDDYARPMFINISENFIVSETSLPVPPPGIIIDLPETVQVSPQLIAAIQNWHDLGFRFSLDNFTFDLNLNPLLPYLDYIKVDVQNIQSQDIATRIKAYADFPMTWIAEKIETEEQFIACARMGFALFQGYFLAKPKLVEGYAIRTKVANSVSLINAVSHPDMEINELTHIVSKDPNLATQLLKIINSPACYISRTVKSLREAIAYLGLAKVQKWIIMMSLMNNAMSNPGAVRLVLTRGKACENYAGTTSFADPEQAFLVGLLSGVQLLFGIRKDLFMNQLNLGPEIMTAVLKHSGYLGQILKEVIEVEYANMMQPLELADQKDLLLNSYHQACDWTEKAIHSTTA